MKKESDYIKQKEPLKKEEQQVVEETPEKLLLMPLFLRVFSTIHYKTKE